MLFRFLYSKATVDRCRENGAQFCLRSNINRIMSQGKKKLIALPAVLVCIGIGACTQDVDVSHITNISQFMAACKFCIHCDQPGAIPYECVKDGENCEPLCPNKASGSWTKGGLAICRCIGTNNFWVFDEKTGKVSLKDAPP